MNFRLIFAGVMAVVASNPAQSQLLPPPRPLSMPDPIRAASLPFDLAQPTRVAEGQWSVLASWAAFNSWSTAVEMTEIHHEMAPDLGVIPSSAEFRALEERHPTKQFHYVDIEGNIFEISASRGLPGGWIVGFRVPWMTIGNPNSDSVIDQWHSWFGLTVSHRATFPNDETLFYSRGHDGTIENRDLTGSGFGDISVSAATPELRVIGGSHRLVAAVEAPTGDSGTLWGSGGWDLGLRLHSNWTWKRSRLQAGIGLNSLDDQGDFLGITRSDMWFVGTSFEYRLGRRLIASAAVTLESSPLADFTDGEAGEPALFRFLGLALEMSPQWLAELQYGNNKEGFGIAPDASLRLMVIFYPSGS